MALICGPPPCTTTGWMPQLRRNAMSAANARRSVSSVIALPPYLITTILPCNCLSQGNASASTWAFAWMDTAPAVMTAADDAVGTARLRGTSDEEKAAYS